MNERTNIDRLLATWFDEGPAVLPDRVAVVVADRIGRQPQRRAWRLDRRPKVNLLLKVVLAAALGAAMLGGAVLIAGTRNDGPSPTPAPTASASPASPAPTFAVAPLPTTMIGNWVANIGEIAGLGNTDPRIRLVTANDGSALWLLTNKFGNTAMRTVPTAVGDGELHVASEEAGIGCAIGDEGSYRVSVSADGLQITFDTIDDICTTRAAVLARTWVRTVDFASKGGPGAIAAFDPVFTIQLPDGVYSGTPEIGAAAEVSTADRTLVAVKDPWGLGKPCTTDGSDKLPVDPSADAFVGYLRTLPGFTVEPEELTIDGHRVVHAAISTDVAIDCPAGEVSMWTPKAFTSQSRWAVTPGAAASVYLVEVDGDLVLLQWAGEGVTTQEEQDVLSTIRFLDALPIAP